MNLSCAFEFVYCTTDGAPRDPIGLGELCLAGELSTGGQLAGPNAV
nr:hypothetical protein OG296_23205 [Streptomyces sp. NBC_01001]